MNEKKGGVGRIYRRRMKDAATGEVRTLPTWWIQYGHEGRDLRESSDSHVRRDAEELLRRRIREIEDRTLVPRADRLTIEDLAKAIETNYAVKGRRSTERLGTSLKHLRARLALVPAPRLPEKIPAYVRARLEEGASAGSVRLELLALTKALKLTKLRHVADAVREHVPAPDPSAVRKGFVTRDRLDAILARLRDDVRPAIEFAFYTGMRKGEFVGLRWTGVDREAGTLTLRAEDVKNATARTIPYRAVPRLEEIVETQWERAQDVLRRTGRFPERVFFRKDGDPIRDFRTMWTNAVTAAGLPGLVPHDLRRSAAREMTLHGIPDRVIQAIAGWKTSSTLRRYQVLSTDDLAEQMGRLAGDGTARERVPRRAAGATRDEGT